MADSDKTLKLLIEMGVIGKEDVAAANGLLAETGTTAAASANAATDLGGAHKKLAEETKGASEAAKEHEVHLQGGQKAFGILNKLVPELGHELHALFLGPVGPAILLGIAVATVREKLAAYNEELDKVGEAEIEEHAAAVARLQNAWQEAEIALGKYWASMATAGGEKDPTKKQLDNIKAVTDAALDANKKEIESLGRIEVAYLRAHHGTPEQIAAAEERTRASVEKIDRTKQFEDGVGSLMAEDEDRKKNDRARAAEAVAALDTAAKAKQKFDEQSAELAGLWKKPEASALAEEKAGVDARLMAAKTAPDFISNPMVAGGRVDMREENKKFLEETQSESDRLEVKMKSLREREAQLKRDLAETAMNKDIAETDAATKTEISIHNRARLSELPGEISQAQKVQGATDQGRAAVDVLNQRGGQLHMTLGELVTATHKTHEQTVKIIESVVSGHASFALRMAQLEAQVAAIRGRTNGG